MTLAAKICAPAEVYQELTCLTPLPAPHTPLALFNAPPGYLLTGCLAGVLAQAGRPVVWLRLGPEDCDPASFLLALIGAAQPLQPELGQDTQHQMRIRPGPVQGWPPLFLALGRELNQGLPPHSALVIEDFHHLYAHPQTFPLFRSYLLPALQNGIGCFLISHQTLKKSDFPLHSQVVGVYDLRLDSEAGVNLARRYAPELPPDSIRRALALSDGRPEALVSLFTASRMLAPGLVRKAITQANTLGQLCAALLRDGLTVTAPNGVQALALALQLNYLHPDLAQAVWGEATLPYGPWLQPRGNRWFGIRSLWREALKSTLRIPYQTNQELLQRAADFLFQSGAASEAVPLYFQLGDVYHAAQAIDSVYESMLDLGQWEQLGQWLHRLPEDIFKDWPWLAYSLGEIEAAQGDLPQAQSAFARASGWFLQWAEPGGACMSRLAESALAAWQEDYEKARRCAQEAQQIAQDRQLTWHLGWADWQLGCLAAGGARIDQAADYFQHSAETLKTTPFTPLLAEATLLAAQQVDFQRQRQQHLQAIQEVDRQESEVSRRLAGLIHSPVQNLEQILASQNWSKIPLMLKLTPALLDDQPEASVLHRTPGWKSALGRLARLSGLRAKPRQAAGEAPPGAYNPPAPSLTLRLAGPLEAYAANAPVEAPSRLTLPAAVDRSLPVEASASADPASSAGLTVYCLGPFRVFHEAQYIENWGSKKAQQILKYLLIHRQHPVPKETLMDTIWPEADPEAARRNLHQAIYVLRQTLKTELGLNCIQFENDGYRIDPSQSLWCDYEAFEQYAQAGQRLEQAGQSGPAMAAYGKASGLYQDDFLVEDLYEDWPKSQREYLWQLYLSLAQRLAEYYLEHKEYTAALALGRRILQKDGAQEPAHQILMRAYAGQGLRHLAVRQYKNCVQALRQELALPPSPETQALYQSLIRK